MSGGPGLRLSTVQPPIGGEQRHRTPEGRVVGHGMKPALVIFELQSGQRPLGLACSMTGFLLVPRGARVVMRLKVACKRS